MSAQGTQHGAARERAAKLSRGSLHDRQAAVRGGERDAALSRGIWRDRLRCLGRAVCWFIVRHCVFTLASRLRGDQLSIAPAAREVTVKDPFEGDVWGALSQRLGRRGRQSTRPPSRQSTGGGSRPSTAGRPHSTCKQTSRRVVCSRAWNPLFLPAEGGPLHALSEPASQPAASGSGQRRRQAPLPVLFYLGF